MKAILLILLCTTWILPGYSETWEERHRDTGLPTPLLIDAYFTSLDNKRELERLNDNLDRLDRLNSLKDAPEIDQYQEYLDWQRQWGH